MEEIILTLRPPSKAVLAADRGGGSRFLVNGTPAWGSFPPWGSCPEVLCEASSRVLCGVAYGVHESCRAQVKGLVDLMDPRAVRYREFRGDPTASDLSPGSVVPAPLDPKAIPWTAQQFPDEDYLEILWTEARRDMFGLAQLGSDTWFYTRFGEVLALRISYLDEIAETYDLVLPDQLAFPALEVSCLAD